MHESAIIELFFVGTPTNPAAGPDDDCAALPRSSDAASDEILTTDALAEGVHFRRDWSGPEDVASKLLHVNLSDITADGGVPTWCALNLGLPRDLKDDWIRAFASEFLQECRAAGVELIGGDTFRAPGIVLGLTMGGVCPHRRIPRSGGEPGDLLWITGAPGLALLGYRILQAGDVPDENARNSDAPRSSDTSSPSPRTSLEGLPAELRERALARFRRPRARLELGVQLAAAPETHAMLDLSDGIVADAPRLARASGVDLELELAKLPLPAGAEQWITPEEACTSGEELELLFLAAPSFANHELARAGHATAIGRAVASASGEGSLRIRDRAGAWLDPTTLRGFEHF